MTKATPVLRDRGRALVRRLAGAVLVLAALGLAACGGESGPTLPRPTPSPPIVLPEGDGTVWLEVEQHPGYPLIEFSLGRAPLYRLTVGGDLYFEGPTPSIFPGYLLPNLRHTRLGDGAFVRIRAAAAALRLSEIEEEVITDLASIVADAPTTTVTQTDRAGEHRLSVYALYFDEHTDPRVALVKSLLETLGNASDLLGSEEWRGDRLQVWVLASEPFWEPDLATEEPWPLTEPPGPVGEPDCRVFAGAERARLFALFESANHGYRWLHEGNHYQLIPRPLFPGEEGCAGAR